VGNGVHNSGSGHGYKGGIGNTMGNVLGESQGIIDQHHGTQLLNNLQNAWTMQQQASYCNAASLAQQQGNT